MDGDAKVMGGAVQVSRKGDGAWKCMDGNEAAASVAYRLSEVIAIYPITPASAMGEHADDWSAARKPNLWGSVPDVIEMQSEAGAAGAVHGALQAGALATTFTASQGLMLMLPDLYKIAGELTPFCLHVAARALAAHALSIFGDHADVMAARTTGVALLASASVQEAQDLALVSHMATLAARVPFLHFFDGFRTSHEVATIQPLTNDDLHALIDREAIAAHRARRLTPDAPVMRGTAQNPDAYFPSREACNPFYAAVPEIVETALAKFAARTGRKYGLVDYYGAPDAEHVVVLMGSGGECVSEVVDALNARGGKTGLLRVRLYRPFPADRLIAALPASVKTIAVLDRTKEPGAQGEPLFLDVLSALTEAWQAGATPFATLPRVIGGRYGLGGREFDPGMVKAVFDEMGKAQPKRRFTVGIRDDVSYLSLTPDEAFSTEGDGVVRALFYGLGSDGTVSSNKASVKILGEETDRFAQGHFVYDSKKSGSTTVSHLRFGPSPIRSTYEIRRASFVAVHDPGLLDRLDVLARAEPGATVLLNVPWKPEEVWEHLPREIQESLLRLHCKVHVIDAFAVAEAAGLGRRINTVMQVCFFALSGVLPHDEAIAHIKESIAHTWGKRGDEVVRRNVEAVDAALANLHELALPTAVNASRTRRLPVAVEAPQFVQEVTAQLLAGAGETLPVSAFPPDGTWPTGTSKWEKRGIALEIPIWQPDVCVQCNRCAMVCPHAAIRAKAYTPDGLAGAPEDFQHKAEKFNKEFVGLEYTIQVAPEDCTGCGLCVEICPAKDRKNPKRKALVLEDFAVSKDREKARWAFFEKLPDPPRTKVPHDARTLPVLRPLFEFSGACTGCGETPYLGLLTRLFGDRLLIANATGCSSIYGGNLPTTPYTKDANGRGPAWSNSLFEDNAEFGFGMRAAVDQTHRRAHELLDRLSEKLDAALVDSLRKRVGGDDEAGIETRRADIVKLRDALAKLEGPDARELLQLADDFTPRSVWLVGGDGWAYDIGFGGLDHVLASHRKVNILVLDTEVYSNTGGQQSKATPLGAVARFAAAGKATRKKDLGLLAMSYGHVYVAEIAMHARASQAVEAMLEAERHPGPALLIAHSPCIAHGYDLVHAIDQQKRAVDSGAWPLYRFDPHRTERGLAPLVLDSGAPKIPLKKYMDEEARFRMVALRDPDRYTALVRAAERAAAERRAVYEQLSGIRMPTANPSQEQDR